MHLTLDLDQTERERNTEREVSQREHTLEGGQIRQCQTTDCFRHGSANRQGSCETRWALRIAHPTSYIKYSIKSLNTPTGVCWSSLPTQHGVLQQHHH